MIVIVDYGMGNLGSVFNMFKHIGIKALISSEASIINNADKLILPGVGSFDKAIIKIKESGLDIVLNQKVLQEKIPILGICLGMQLLTDKSEEGELPGLGWIPGKTIRFPAKPGIKIPHMGWNYTTINRPSILTKKLPEDTRFYFVHSFCVKIDNPDNSILQSFHGIKFDSAIQKNNIFGVQFHPEKSHKYGMNILRNFANL